MKGDEVTEASRGQIIQGLKARGGKDMESVLYSPREVKLPWK